MLEEWLCASVRYVLFCNSHRIDVQLEKIPLSRACVTSRSAKCKFGGPFPFGPIYAS